MANKFVLHGNGIQVDYTIGQDVNGDTLFTDRPGNPIIPRNSGKGPAQFALNMRLTKTITLHEPPDGSKRDPYELTLSVNGRNILNHPNYALPVGNLSSPLFGQSTALAAGGGGSSAAGVRRLDLQVKFSW